jgi:ATP-dependent RNA helicase RhlB
MISLPEIVGLRRHAPIHCSVLVMTEALPAEMSTDELSHLTNQRFDQFDLRPELLEGLAKAGFDYCTEIQAEALPLVLAGIDVAGQAHTGTGKTAAFLLAIFQRLLANPSVDLRVKGSVRAVVLAPTRELAIQIHRDAQTLGAFTGLRLGLVYGGTGYQQQRTELSDGVDVLIGTPGRFIDYFKQRLFDLKHVEVVVLDEADRMFDLGFIKDIRYVLRRMPSPTQRLNMLFSATLSYRIKELAYEYMNDPRTVTIASNTPVADRLVEQVYYPANSEKLLLLLGVMDRMRGNRMLVFANTRITCDQLGRRLSHHGYSTGVLSGDVPQHKRERLLEQFKIGDKQILVATDVAARGLHIPHVSHVFNYDLPQDPEDYVHRIGRTARAGESGYAISFACEEHAISLLDIEIFIGHPLKKMEISDDLLKSSRKSEQGRDAGQPIRHTARPTKQQSKTSPQKTAPNEKKQHQRQPQLTSKSRGGDSPSTPPTGGETAEKRSSPPADHNARRDYGVPAIG